jgi:hypothetical protein
MCAAQQGGSTAGGSMRRSFLAVVTLIMGFGGAAPLGDEQGTRCTLVVPT